MPASRWNPDTFNASGLPTSKRASPLDSPEPRAYLRSMENETRTDCEQGLHRWGKLYVCRSGPKRVCGECGQIAATNAYDEWILVAKK